MVKMLPEEQIAQIKQQLIQQIDSTFPEDKKEFAKQQIEAMNSEQLEEFLKQNKLIKTQTTQVPQTQQEPQTQQSIFRNIVSGQISSSKIDENKYAIAVLEINPVSKGHTILIPKQEATSVEKIPQPVFSLAKKVSKKIKSKLKPKEVKISSSNAFGEFIINVFPVYENESLNSQRYHADETELQELQRKLEKKTIKKIIK
ncbi:unnamed protein product, partial [marine sediment metagenome]